MINKINEKIVIDGISVENRVVFQPMEGCDGKPNGGITELTRRRYLRFAEGSAGIIWFEAVAVCKEGRANPRQLWLNEENKEEFKELIAEIKRVAKEKTGIQPLIIMQATHSGRYSKPNGNFEPIIAYHNPIFEFGKEDLGYTIATDFYCVKIEQMYAKTAQLATECGFDGIDVKCCHGYLFNEFLSAYSRAGIYGGTLENRSRLFLNCIKEVKANISKKMLVTTRFNAYDGFDYPCGFGVDKNSNIDLTEAKSVIAKLRDLDIKLINITIGNPYLLPSINRPCIIAGEDGDNGVERVVSITAELQKSFKDINFVCSALTFKRENSLDYANDILAKGKASLVGFGRMIFAYPSFYTDYLKNGKLEKNKCCLTCAKCSQLMRSGSVTGCPIRDSEVYFPLYKEFVMRETL